jgi:hypothetical protein
MKIPAMPQGSPDANSRKPARILAKGRERGKTVRGLETRPKLANRPSPLSLPSARRMLGCDAFEGLKWERLP